MTARLSARYCEKFGDDLTNERVGWLNPVDTTYRSARWALSQLNFARCDANLEQRLDTLDAKWEQRVAARDAKPEHRMTELRAHPPR